MDKYILYSKKPSAISRKKGFRLLVAAAGLGMVVGCKKDFSKKPKPIISLAAMTKN